MGQPATTIGSHTSHGTPLAPGPGSLNVLINGKPAWRVGLDYHSCPLNTDNVPHVGGTVLIGSMTVLINKMPAARMGDQIIENGPPNAIAVGSPNVLIG